MNWKRWLGFGMLSGGGLLLWRNWSRVVGVIRSGLPQKEELEPERARGQTSGGAYASRLDSPSKFTRNIGIE